MSTESTREQKDWTPCLEIVSMANIQARPEPDWLWRGRFPTGMLTMIAGIPGLGKSFVTQAMAALVSTGGTWPDSADEPSEAGNVLLFSAEDSPEYVIKPRLEAMEADMDRIKIVVGTKRNRADGVDSFSLTQDIAELGKAVEEHKPRLMVIDPISAYYGDTDTHKNAAVRAALNPLKGLLERAKCAGILIEHLNKRETGNSMEKVQGSIGAIAACRAAWLVAKHNNHPEVRALANIKFNIGRPAPAITFQITDEKRIQWGRQVDTDADEQLANSTERGIEQCEMVNWLLEQLKDGPVSSRKLEELAKSEGFSWNKLGRLKLTAGIESRKVGNDGWVWQLKDAA